MSSAETTFKAAYGKLNTAQKEAVDALDGPVMVVAGRARMTSIWTSSERGSRS